MDSSKLADRLRGILNPAGVRSGIRLHEGDERSGFSRAHLDLERLLGGQWQQHAAGACFVVERRTDARTMCGRAPVGELAARLVGAAAEAPLIAGGAPARPPFLFFDLETTGLSGGAGTYAFLVGFGSFDEEGGFITRQFVLLRFADERALLATVADELARAGAIVSFNGKSFDAPFLETRYLFHRLEWVGAWPPHVDVLHPARRFWGHGGVRGAREGHASCSLVSLERQVLGAERVSDVQGFEIPARYFQFVRSGDAGPLAAVLEHNRLDLLSLAGVTARLVHLVRSGPEEARDAREALALGHLYARAGLDGRARVAFSRAAKASIAAIRVDALRALALMLRRGRQYDEAAGCWRQLLDVCGCPRHIAREATEALAIHHEHRARDLAAARAFALQSLESGRPSVWNQAVQHRLARIERKMASGPRPGFLS
jgi:uncharacterized protein YprB with RNaseH-like and TPR domain